MTNKDTWPVSVLASILLYIGSIWLSQAAAQYDEDGDVCCRRFSGENLGFMPREQCTSRYGDAAADAFCKSAQNSKVCCRGFAGENLGYMRREQCTGRYGDVAADAFCEAIPKFEGYSVDVPAQCVKNVESFFTEGNFSYRPNNGGSNDDASGRFRMNFLHDNRLPPQDRRVKAVPLSDFDHMQGLARIDVADESYFVGVMGLGGEMGLESKYDNGAMYAFRMGEAAYANRVGKSLVIPGADDPKKFIGGDGGGKNKAVSYMEFLTSTHPGGIQASGTIVAVPVTCDMGDCDGPSVKFFDFDDPARPVLVHEKPMDRLIDGKVNDNAHWAAFTRLKDDRYLLLVNRGDNGVTDVSVTKQSGVLRTETEWEEFPRFNVLGSGPDDVGVPQNVSLFYECDSGQLYLLAQGPVASGNVLTDITPGVGGSERRWEDDNYVALIKITGRLSQGSAKPELVSKATSERHGDYCQMGGGSSLYITDDHEPIVYCAAGWASKHGMLQGNGAILKVSELTSMAGDYGKDRVDRLE